MIDKQPTQPGGGDLHVTKRKAIVNDDQPRSSPYRFTLPGFRLRDTALMQEQTKEILQLRQWKTEGGEGEKKKDTKKHTWKAVGDTGSGL